MPTLSPTLKVTLDELELAGVSYTFEKSNGGHFKVFANGLPMIVCSTTCSDHRAVTKARCLVRRLLKTAFNRSNRNETLFRQH
jgi:hypothetical protein